MVSRLALKPFSTASQCANGEFAMRQTGAARGSTPGFVKSNFHWALYCLVPFLTSCLRSVLSEGEFLCLKRHYCVDFMLYIIEISQIMACPACAKLVYNQGGHNTATIG